MPWPTKGDVHVNVPLTQISTAYIQSHSNFIASSVFPNIPVNHQSDRYYRYIKGDWFRNQSRRRAPATESAGGGYRVDNTPTYMCDVWAVHKDVDDQTRANSDIQVRLDWDATEWCTQNLLIRKETEWFNTFFVPNIWDIELTGVAAAPAANQFLSWLDDDSNPIVDITNAGIMIAEQTGFRPNKLVLGPYLYNVLKNHPTILDRIKYTQKGVVTLDLLSVLFEVDQVLVPWSVMNLGPEFEDPDQPAGTNMRFIARTTAVMDDPYALLCYSAPSPSLMQPTAGYTFSWRGLYGAGAWGNRMKSFRIEPIASDRIEGEAAWDMKMVCSDLAVLFRNCLA